MNKMAKMNKMNIFTSLSFLQLILYSQAFAPVSRKVSSLQLHTSQQTKSAFHNIQPLYQARNNGGGGNNNSNSNSNYNSNDKTANKQKRNQTKTKNRISVHELVEEYTKTAIKEMNSFSGGSSSSKYKRSRKKVEKPKQTYLYAAQRREMERMGVPVVKSKNKKQNDEQGDKNNSTTNTNTDDDDDDDDDQEENSGRNFNLVGEDSPITIARKMGLNPEMQSCYPSYTLQQSNDDGNDRCKREMIPLTQPKIVGEIQVGDSSSDKSGMYAYIIEKPSGWTILEGNKKKNKKNNSNTDTTDVKKDNNEDISSSNDDHQQQIHANKKKNNKVKTLKYYDQDTSKVGTWELDMEEFDLSSIMTAEELEEFNLDGGIDTFGYNGVGAPPSSSSINSTKAIDDGNNNNSDNNDSTNTSTTTPQNNDNKPAIFINEARPAVVTWLKELKASQGTPIRGGNNWKAIGGATEIDDSGLLILCPKGSVDNVFVDVTEYVAVVGNGKYLAPKGKKNRQAAGAGGGSKQHTLEEVQFETYAKVKKGRGNDIVTTIKLNIPDGASTCNDVVQLSQNKFMDGIRGDGRAHPLELRANRRLVHCSSMTVSSLTHDDLLRCESDLPDDIRVLSERRNEHNYMNGSFLGRSELRCDEGTTAYREINGAADGWPGWIVDRYDKWLLVQHDDMYMKGPLPSLHDGNTVGVYYFSSDPDRSITGAVKGIKPTLLEGQPAPEMIEIKENGIKYHVNFDDLSTGIFLDQRNQRAWLARHCGEETRILNCFSHCGAFSVAAANTGAKTVSLDLDKKWLDRIRPQMEANGIFDQDRHDCIYGDCFDWLARLAKRGEKFDIVILDPPSTSVGGKKKKRWSAKNDYDELVSLAAKLVKRGGILWTTTNSYQISPIKFARMCKKGLNDAGIINAKLDRVATMPLDFPSIGPQQVKNLVWKFPN